MPESPENRSNVSQKQIDDLDNFAEKNLLNEPFSETMTAIPMTLQRGGIYILTLIVAASLCMLYFFKVHVVVTATGTIVPENEGILVQAIENGIVVQALAKAGDHLPQGTPILKMDRPESRLSLASLQRKLELQTTELEKLTTAKQVAQEIMNDPHSLAHRKESIVLTGPLMPSINALAKSWLELENLKSLRSQNFPIQKQQLTNELELVEKRISLLEKELSQSKRLLKEEEQLLNTKKQQLEDFYELAEKGLYSQLEVDREKERYQAAFLKYGGQQKQIEQQKLNISNERLRLSEMRLQLESQTLTNEKNYELSMLNYHQNLGRLKTGLGELENRIQTLRVSLDNTRDEFSLIEQRISYTTITMPVTGILTKMNVKNSGELVRSGQVVAVVMEDGEPLVIQASVSNKDIGFVKEGLQARVKVDAYPFQQFGTLQGYVNQVFPNIGNNKNFSIHVGLLRNFIESDGNQLPLFPGLTVEVDLLTRKQRLIYVLMSGSEEEEPDLESLKKLKETL